MASEAEIEYAKRLSNSFLAATRGDGAVKISTNGSFDAAKIYTVMSSAAIPIQRFELTSPAQAQCDASVTIPGSAITMKAPENCNHYIFNTTKLTSNEVSVYHFMNIYLSYDVRNNGAPQFYIFDKDRRLIDNFLFGATPFISDQIRTITERSVFIDDFFPKYNICHFMFDKLPRWHIANSHFGERQAVLFNTGEYYSEIFSRLSACHSALCPSGARGTVFFSDVVIFSNSTLGLRHPAQHGADLHIDALRKLRDSVRGVASSASRRVMLIRKVGLPRQVANAVDLYPLLQRHGFELVDAEELSAREQIALFCETSVVMGVHGAGLTNLIFQPQGSVVIELLPPFIATLSYWVPATLLGARYLPLLCDDPEQGRIDSSLVKHNPAANNRRDVVVPVDDLEALLKTL